jgi:hypothetical protein
MNATSKPKQLNIRSDEAYRLAHGLARSQHKTTQQVVVDALETYARLSAEPDVVKRRQMEAEFARIRELSRKLNAELPPGATIDHSDMYDKNGLPV